MFEGLGGTVKGVFDLPKDRIEALGIPPHIAMSIIRKKFNKATVERELNLAKRNKTKIITLEDEAYPPLLKNIHFPPPYIYVKGEERCLLEPTIAIVGSRKCSKAASDFARKLATDLSDLGFTVVSGFAYGIDIEAHIGACGKGSTAAVLGSGFLQIYPKNHIKYAEKILEKGCFVTEFPFDEMPLPQNFPRRNRIISGLSLGVAVIEASHRSGSLITARCALEQNREVFAVPHFPSSLNIAGNSLIKGGAKLLETYLDIVEEFAYLLKSEIKTKSESGQSVVYEFDSPIKTAIYEALLVENLNVNELCIKTDVGIIEIITAAAELELEGYIIKDENDRYFPSR